MRAAIRWVAFGSVLLASVAMADGARVSVALPHDAPSVGPQHAAVVTLGREARGNLSVLAPDERLQFVVEASPVAQLVAEANYQNRLPEFLSELAWERRDERAAAARAGLDMQRVDHVLAALARGRPLYATRTTDTAINASWARRMVRAGARPHRLSAGHPLASRSPGAPLGTHPQPLLSAREPETDRYPYRRMFLHETADASDMCEQQLMLPPARESPQLSSSTSPSSTRGTRRYGSADESRPTDSAVMPPRGVTLAAWHYCQALYAGRVLADTDDFDSRSGADATQWFFGLDAAGLLELWVPPAYQR